MMKNRNRAVSQSVSWGFRIDDVRTFQAFVVLVRLVVELRRLHFVPTRTIQMLKG